MGDHIKHFPLGTLALLRLTTRRWDVEPARSPGSTSTGIGPSCSKAARTLFARYPAFILGLTFVVYAAYHASRRPISVVKPALHHPPCNFSGGACLNNTAQGDWVPFDGPNYNELFGTLDMAYLMAYAVSMFVAGHLAERLPLRTFLAFGMAASGLMTAAFGFGYFADIHSLAYYYAIQIVGGIFQSTGWPSVVTCVAAWFGKRKKGLIFGLWNSHTSVGNIVGGLLAAAWVNTAWGWSFVVPGAILFALSSAVYLFMVPSPEEFDDCYRSLATTGPRSRRPSQTRGRESSSPDPAVAAAHNMAADGQDDFKGERAPSSLLAALPSRENLSDESYPIIGGVGVGVFDETTHLLPTPPNNKRQSGEMEAVVSHPRHRGLSPGSSQATPHHSKRPPISIAKAIKVPGVAEFSLCLFFAKAVSYTFLYWLPNYISASSSLDPSKSAQLASIFDFGGILGGVIAGYVADKTDASASVCAAMLALSCPLIYYYHGYGHLNYTINAVLLFTTGLFVNGPYALITTAVSADLGNKISASHHAKALATITAIIDGSGSLGAALGPLVAGLVASKSWWNVFCMLIICDILAIMFLIRLSYREVKLMYQLKKDRII